MSKAPLESYYAAIDAALRARDAKAIPALLTLMALDGYGHEAEDLRRRMLLASRVDVAP